MQQKSYKNDEKKMQPQKRQTLLFTYNKQQKSKQNK